jgi:signal recognition particle subunit SRP54
VIKIVRDELAATLGGDDAKELRVDGSPAVILMCGLQGSGKTTTSGKLAFRLKGLGRKPLLVPADVQRPAAIEQLKKLAAQVGVDAYDTQPGSKVADIAKGALERAERQGQDTLIVDTAGRLHVDLELMDELREAKEILGPKWTVLVVDAMTGQDAVNVAAEFKAQVGIDGVILTKMDGDARGGAALSIKQVTGAPILFTGTGEKVDKLEVFHPERVAQRILGMGDVLSLIEKTQQVYDEKQAKTMAKKFKRAEFSLDDFREQMKMMRQMGDMKDLLKMIPGAEQAMRKMGTGGPDPDKEMRRVEAMLNSMTPEERANPDVLNGSRRKRIANGSGTTVADVNAFLKRFNDAKKVMKKLSKMGPGGLKNLMRGLGM